MILSIILKKNINLLPYELLKTLPNASYLGFEQTTIIEHCELTPIFSLVKPV